MDWINGLKERIEEETQRDAQKAEEIKRKEQAFSILFPELCDDFKSVFQRIKEVVGEENASFNQEGNVLYFEVGQIEIILHGNSEIKIGALGSVDISYSSEKGNVRSTKPPIKQLFLRGGEEPHWVYRDNHLGDDTLFKLEKEDVENIFKYALSRYAK
ncbi:hypothetical protein [Brevibacillus laterosporus]|uniref:hypothetical protein n=1 Tax=Brevibacillus laterosporus TaxID=1465 RepID=UPI000E6D25D1|nr:hypothetical protein [Brevibacillus laterosporus]AYB39692.1 hypothetical protein D5F52_16225 [Brevibacillus laterosporus]